MNPYLILAAAIAWGVSTGGAFLCGQHVGSEHEQATIARVDKAIRDTGAAAQQGAANAIAANKPINKTIVQRTQREVATNTVYADCRVPAAGLRLANEAITGQSEPAGGGVLPGARAAD